MMRVAAASAVAAAAFAGGAGLIAVGGSARGETRAPARELSVDLDEWRVKSSADVVRAGSVEVTQTNTGRVEHELLIVRTDRPADRLPKGLEGVKPSLAGRVVLGREHAHHTGSAGGAAHLAPRRTARSTVRLRPGRYVLLCTIPGHYEAGQRAALEVRAG